MIITQLLGGLGNQMFQYAIGRQLAIKNNCELYLDISQYDSYNKRKYELDEFCITDKKVKMLSYENYTTIREVGHRFNERLITVKDNSYLIGYWQNEKYFKSIREELCNCFLLKKYSQKFQEYECLHIKNAVSIHIRRGDYVSEPHTNQYHGICPINYYTDALAYLYNYIDISKILIFSDDKQWVKDNLNLSSYGTPIIVEGLTPVEELKLMSKCQHNIIANSTFSWWAAWLNQNTDKIIIAPKKWFNNVQANSEQEIVPNNWIRI